MKYMGMLQRCESAGDGQSIRFDDYRSVLGYYSSMLKIITTCLHFMHTG